MNDFSKEQEALRERFYYNPKFANELIQFYIEMTSPPAKFVCKGEAERGMDARPRSHEGARMRPQKKPNGNLYN